MSRSTTFATLGNSPPLDVAIVGTGPAGGAAALALAGSSLRVAVIEKAALPRYKTCGGGLLWRARRLLPVDITSVVERECRVAELVHHRPDLHFACRRDFPIISMVMRDRFDALLVDQARLRGGIEVLENTAVRAVEVRDDHVELGTERGTLRARFVVAADGVTSTVARLTGLPALGGVVPALEVEAAFPAETLRRWSENGRFDFGLITAGYGWVFPKGRHLSIGVGTTRRGAANLQASYRRYARTLRLDSPEHEDRHGYMIPCRPRDRMFSIPRVLLVGDAAGLADPVTAEGITGAILSGQLAARSILSGGHDATVRNLYRRLLDDALLGDLRVARWLAWLLYERPRWFAALLSREGEAMSELMTRIVVGETTYRAAVSRPGHYVRLFMRRRMSASR